MPDRIQGEAGFAESNERLRLALAAGKMGTWTRELDGQRRMQWSPELEGIFGLRPGEFPGTEAALYEYIHPEDRELVRQAFETAIAIKTDYEMEFRFLPRGGPAGWMLGRGRAYYDDAGKALRLVGVAIDITARKLAELEISRLNAELERRVRERTAQLEATNQELEAFVYSVSHDLRAPLRGIRGFSEVLLERYAARLDAEGHELLRRVFEASNRMGTLIDDLLKLSRIGRSELRWQPVYLGALAEVIAEELRESEPGRAVEVVIGPNLRAEGDERLLEHRAGKPDRQRVEIHPPPARCPDRSRIHRRAGAGVFCARQWRRVRHGVRRQAVRRFPAAPFGRGVPRDWDWAGDGAADHQTPLRSHLG